MIYMDLHRDYTGFHIFGCVKYIAVYFICELVSTFKTSAKGRTGSEQ